MKNKYRRGLKTSWEKEKLLFKSNFFFPHDVFPSYISLFIYISLVCQNAASCGDGLQRKFWQPAFSPFQQYFQKGSSSSSLKAELY